LLFSNKITQAICTFLGKKLKQGAEMSDIYEIQEGLSEADKRNFNHRCEDCSNNEKIKVVQNYVGKKNEEKSNHEKQEITSDNSEGRSDEGKQSNY
jgi:hypothetical protein